MAGLLSFFGKKYSISSSEAQLVAAEIVGISNAGAKILIDDLLESGLHSTDLNLCRNELIYFVVHYASRLLYVAGGVAAQDAVYDKIVFAVLKDLAASEKFTVDSYEWKSYVQAINDREFIYSQCKEFAPKGENSPKNTLLWEASKLIVGSTDIAAMAIAQEFIALTLMVTLKEKSDYFWRACN